MMESGSFLLKTLGLGLVTGFVFGYLFKKVSKIVLFVVAVVIVLVFVLGHNEILEIDWLSLKDRSSELFDTYFNRYNERLRIFLRNIPFTIGLIIGALIGLKKV
jgi:uncharacterized membrane protein (Fun14 family)